MKPKVLFLCTGMCLVTIQNAPGVVHIQEFADIRIQLFRGVEWPERAGLLRSRLNERTILSWAQTTEPCVQPIQAAQS